MNGKAGRIKRNAFYDFQMFLINTNPHAQVPKTKAEMSQSPGQTRLERRSQRYLKLRVSPNNTWK